MTGYGRGEASCGDITVVVELRSVNNRFCDVHARCPREYLPIEPRVHRMLKRAFARGRIDAFVRRGGGETQDRVVADPSLVRDYARAVRTVEDELPDGIARDVSATFLLSQPGVLSVREEFVDALTEWDVLETALQGAIDDLEAMRRTEGAALRVDLSEHLAVLGDQLVAMEQVADGVNERLMHRLEGRLQRLLGERFDPQRLLQEAAVLADKADIHEEIARMKSHCDQFRTALGVDEPVGRRLDFLLQEMHREVNTMGSKAAEHPITHRVVEMKSTLERMREQSANVE